jgi:hypothetical protein
MQVEVNPNFPYPTMFLIGSRAAGASAPPAQAVGVLIVKQTVLLDGSIPAKDQQQPVLLTDEAIDPAGPDDDDLVTYLEADLAAYKPLLDVVAARSNFHRGLLGSLRIDHGDGNGFQPNPGLSLHWGWLSRVDDQDPSGTANPRKGQTGNVASFVPDVNDPTKLPSGFQNAFFNGGRIRTLAHLNAGNRVEFGSTSRQVTIPAGPSLAVKVNGQPISPPVSIDLNADTVVYDQTAGRYLITWRAVFLWESRLANATLEVS